MEEALSGLQKLRMIKDGELDRPSMGKTIPMRMIDVEFGYALFEAVADENHLNPAGLIHGGFASTVLDSATGCALQSTLPPFQFFATVDLHVKMLKPVPIHMPLIVEAKKIHISKRLGVSEGELRDEEGTIYAHATSTCMVINVKR